jgi:hypothetical protein
LVAVSSIAEMKAEQGWQVSDAGALTRAHRAHDVIDEIERLYRQRN